MVKILLLQGANLTFLGRREPEIYGSTMPAELDATLRCHAHDHAYQLEIFYTNMEGEAINRIYQAVDEGFDGLVMNPAGFTYAGFALRDCIKGAGLPYVEVHISSIAKRNIHCVLSECGRRNDYRFRDLLLHSGPRCDVRNPEKEDLDTRDMSDLFVAAI
jgi:3-dehydroquinate dehydratase II